mmetsp:Transcript_8588/g.13277  ORF Transcript_8588/g.13277 Transcript_8588/m.13277 type:complete len:125 (-) Transcript_8588:4208-4582(-)
MESKLTLQRQVRELNRKGCALKEGYKDVSTLARDMLKKAKKQALADQLLDNDMLTDIGFSEDQQASSLLPTSEGGALESNSSRDALSSKDETASEEENLSDVDENELLQDVIAEIFDVQRFFSN